MTVLFVMLSVLSAAIAALPAFASRDGFARSLSLDLLAQLKGFEKNGQFRFTPPTHALLAFDQALRELETEGGVRGRNARYAANHDALIAGMARLGFEPFLSPDVQSCIITAFAYPSSEAFEFGRFYRELSERGFIIYPGKLTEVDTFRIGNIGRVFREDMDQLVLAIGAVCRDMGVLPPETPVLAGA